MLKEGVSIHWANHKGRIDESIALSCACWRTRQSRWTNSHHQTCSHGVPATKTRTTGTTTDSSHHSISRAMELLGQDWRLEAQEDGGAGVTRSRGMSLVSQYTKPVYRHPKGLRWAI